MIPSFDHTGPFIWAAYALTALALSGTVAAIAFRARSAKHRLERLEREDEE